MPPAPATIRRNTLINLGGAVAPIVVSLVTVPLYLDEIGEARYGVLAVVWLLLGYFGVFDLGIGRATANQLARGRAEGSARRGEILWTGLAATGVLGVAGGACLFVGAHLLFTNVLDVPGDLRDEARSAIPFLALAVPFVVLTALCTGALEGLERFLAANVVDVVRITAYQVGPLSVAYAHGRSLTWPLVAVAAAPVASALVGLAACVAYVPLRGRPRLDRPLAHTMLRYGGWLTVTSLLVPLLTMLDRLVIGAVSGTRAVTQYTVPVNLVTRLNVLPMSLSRTLFPRFSSLEAGRAREVARDAALGLLAVLTPLVVVGLVLVEPFLEVWVGSGLARVSAPVGAIALLGVWINSLSFVPQTLLEGQGRPDLPAKLHLLELLPYAVALWLGLSHGGIEGAAWVWAGRNAVHAALLVAVSGLHRAERAALAPGALAVGGGCAAALTLFSEPVWRLSLGAALVAVSCAWAWRIAPQPVRVLTAQAALLPARAARGLTGRA